MHHVASTLYLVCHHVFTIITISVIAGIVRFMMDFYVFTGRRAVEGCASFLRSTSTLLSTVAVWIVDAAKAGAGPLLAAWVPDNWALLLSLVAAIVCECLSCSVDDGHIVHPTAFETWCCGVSY